MLRITQTISDLNTVLRIEGKLLAPWIDELRTTAETARAGGRSLTLDLARLSYADSAGIALLSELVRQGISVSACSGYIAALLPASRT